MNYIDLLIIVVLIIGVARGFIDGFIKEFASLLALVLGIWGAIRFSSFIAGKLYDYFDMTGKYVGIIAFLITFLIIVILVHFLGMVVDKFAESISLGFLNRILGIVFGLIKNALVLSVLFVILNAIEARHHFLPKEAIAHSRFYNPIADIAPAIFPIIGEGNFDKSFDRFKKKPEDTPI
jgi:membrane protein required for colicin V production